MTSLNRSVRLCVRVAVLVVGFSAWAASAHAQGFFSPFIGYNFGGDAGRYCESFSNCEDKRLNWGFGFGSLGKVFGFEEEFAYTSNFFGETPNSSSSVWTLMSNPMLAPKIGPVRPYGLLGIGIIKAHSDLSPTSLVSFSNTEFGWDVGGGLMLVFGHFGVRGDIRHFHTFGDVPVIPLTNTKLDFGRASAGVVFAF
jgi:opacity protein-like surface antigen